MFCSSCGSNLPHNAKFCPNCGVPAGLTASQSIAKGTPTTSETFEEFRDRKKNERMTRFNTSTAKKPKTSQESPAPVSIQIGLITFKDGELKIKRGSNLPIKVSPEIDMESLKCKAVQKHSQFNSQLEKSSKLYYLLYPDKTIVKHVPGTSEAFTLKGYKEAIGKSFSRLTLYLCTVLEYVKSAVDSCSSDEGDKLNTLADSNAADRPCTSTSVVDLTVDSGVAQSSSSDHSDHKQRSSTPSNRDSGSYNLYCDLLSYEDWSDSGDDLELPSFLTEQSGKAMETNESTERNPTSVKEILQSFKIDVSDIEDAQILRVRRRHVWSDCLRAFSKPDFATGKLLNVHFIGEVAVDMGGPRRELLRLLMQELISTSGVFTGDEKRKSLTGNPLLLTKQVYFQAGRMVMTSLTQGGPALKCLSPAVFAYLCGSPDKCRALLDLKDIPDPEYQDKLKEIQSFPSETFTDDVKKHTEFLLDMGLSKPTWNAEEKPLLLKMLCEHLVVNSNKAALDQFIQGLESSKELYQCMIKNSKMFEPIFCFTNQDLTPANFRDLYEYSFSYEGSNAREGEELTSLWFEELVDRKEISLTKLLVFITGADEVPPLGFSKKIEIKFFTQKEGERRLPHSSTCSLELFVPRGVQSFNEFDEMLRQSLFDTCGFGSI